MWPVVHQFQPHPIPTLSWLCYKLYSDAPRHDHPFKTIIDNWFTSIQRGRYKWEDRRTGLHWKTERKSVQFVSRVWFFATPENRRIKEPLDESERGEWKSWLKAQHSENKDHSIWSYHFMANRWRTVETVSDFILGAPKSLQMVILAMKLKDACSLEENLWQI